MSTINSAQNSVNLEFICVLLSLHQRTPLHVAVETAHTTIVKYLVDGGADITIKDDNGVIIDIYPL